MLLLFGQGLTHEQVMLKLAQPIAGEMTVR